MFSYLIVVYILCNVPVFGSNTTFENVTSLATGNDLWFGLVRDCKKPTTSCIKHTIYDYLKDTFNYEDDVNFTSFLKFSKNGIAYENNENESNEIRDDFIQDETPLEEISRSLKEQSIKFFMTHDLEISLPEKFFLSSILKVSPRNLDDNATSLKIEIIPKNLQQSVGQGRIFTNLIGKIIKNFITERLLYAFLAILVVIKLLAVNFLFFLPSMIGVVTAKKLIVKVLLFLFPALHHLFKLCEYTPYGAKHHIHKHQIAHIHQVAAGHHHYHKPHIEEVGPHFDGPPHHLHHDDLSHYSEFAHKDDTHYGPDDSYPAGSHENEVYHKDPDEKESDFWGFGYPSRHPKPDGKKHMSATEIENMVLKAEKEALIKARLQKERLRIHEENLRLQDQLNNALKIQQKLKHHATLATSKIKPVKIKPHPLLNPLIPPPRPPTSSKYPQTQFEEPPVHLGDFQNLDTDSQPGEFAEPPVNYVEPAKKFVEHSSNVAQPFLSTQNSEAPSGTIGAGLPGDTVNAVQNYLNQKSSQQQQQQQQHKQIYPVYPTNQIQNFVTPQKINRKESQLPLIYVPGQSAIPSKPSSTTASSINRKTDVLSPEEEFYQAASITYDAFYSPILEKIDSVLNLLNFKEELCRERLICSMYKNPLKFSPHSNRISSELSRDAKELQKPKTTNAAVIRFYKYVQAARDGQDQRDCLRLYPSCSINTDVLQI